MDAALDDREPFCTHPGRAALGRRWPGHGCRPTGPNDRTRERAWAPPDVPCSAPQPPENTAMAKGMDKQKEQKKKPAKTAKEKKAEKNEKKSARGFAPT